MGMDAEVFAIGPFKAFHEDDLDYPLRFYDGVKPDDRIIVLVDQASTTEQSVRLAEICGVDPWDLGHHQIKRIVTHDSDLIKRISRLVAAGCEVWYRPNG